MRRPRGQGAGAQTFCGEAERHPGAVQVSQGTLVDFGAPTGRWELWFAARPTLPTSMRGYTKSGKLRRGDPVLPPSANERSNLTWPDERKLVGYWRGEGARLAREAGIPPLGRIRVSAVIYRRALGVADEDNDRSRLKPLLDSLRDAAVIANDTRRYVEYGEVSEQRIGDRGSGVLLIVEALEI